MAKRWLTFTTDNHLHMLGFLLLFLRHRTVRLTTCFTRKRNPKKPPLPSGVQIHHIYRFKFMQLTKFRINITTQKMLTHGLTHRAADVMCIIMNSLMQLSTWRTQCVFYFRFLSTTKDLIHEVNLSWEMPWKHRLYFSYVQWLTIFWRFITYISQEEITFHYFQNWLYYMYNEAPLLKNRGFFSQSFSSE